ncbi:MAG: imidazole glycerol phosphate synthase subunit HisH [Gammaproteobacteria bacterium]
MATFRTVTIVDYAIGNIGSLVNMLDFLEVDCIVAESASSIAQAESLILPGVGAFDAAMRELTNRGWIDALNEAALQRRIPVLGVCLGMQILGKSSEEGLKHGLGWIDANAIHLAPPAGSDLKVPHIGWAEVDIARRSPLFPDVRAKERFYFVHSYALRCADSQIVAATIRFGQDVCCAVAQDNIFGVQFHPEKSHQFGMRLLKDFMRHV